MVVVAVIAVLLIVGLWDGLSNWGKVYGNVSINGMNVAGMNEQELRSSLESTFGERIAGTEITMDAENTSEDEAADDTLEVFDERDVLAQMVAAEYSDTTTSWSATTESLNASLPYDSVIEEAMAAGRGGGPFGRLALMLSPADIPLDVDIDSSAVETIAANIDRALGDTRVDATVLVEDGEARVLPGHDGEMVDRDWLTSKLKESLMSEAKEVSFTVNVEPTPSRTTTEQAQQTCDAINHALQSTATFKYHDLGWTADGNSLSQWTKVLVAKDGDGYALKPVIDRATATEQLVEGLGATVSADDVVVSFENTGEDILVRTSGTGVIPEISPALSTLEESLYGTGGIAWNAGANQALTIDIGESNAPESMTFDEALGLGLITVIGEYSTTFSNDEGTENRNHNIKLAADLLNNSIVSANGGSWSFNETSGDTNLDPPFASAGSIVNGEFVESIGGGICQVATTVFNAVYEAGLDIDQRWNHTIFIASYPEGRDASVNYPDRDLVWSNPLPSDVLLKMSYTDTSVTAQLYGVYTGYRVESEEGEWEHGAAYQTTFETDSSLSSGQSYIKTYGEDGSSFSVTRRVYDKDDHLISENTFYSNYPAKNQVYVVGPGTDTSAFVNNSSSDYSY